MYGIDETVLLFPVELEPPRSRIVNIKLAFWRRADPDGSPVAANEKEQSRLYHLLSQDFTPILIPPFCHHCWIQSKPIFVFLLKSCLITQGIATLQSLLSPPGVWSRVPDDSSCVCVQRIVLLNKIGCNRPYALGLPRFKNWLGLTNLIWSQITVGEEVFERCLLNGACVF